MRTALTTLTDELRRLKAAGVSTVPVSDESLGLLKNAVKGYAAAHAGGGRRGAPRAAPVLASDLRTGSSGGEAKGNEPRLGVAAPAAGRVVAGLAPSRAAEKLPPPPAVALPEGDKTLRWNALKELVLNDPVCQAHVMPGKKVVLGVGSLEADIFFVGEAPGAEEEIQGEPFVGPAGQLLTKMIGGMGLSRQQVYIGNIMNWRPQLPTDANGVQYGNRPPTEAEMTYCLPFLKAQIEIVNPRILVALGATAAQGLLGHGTFKALGEIRGRWREFAGKPLLVTYHPSYILRNPTNRSKRMIWEDLLKVMERGGLAVSEKQRGFFLDR